MSDSVLFEVTKDSLETGLRGVPVGYCTTSHVDPVKGLTYVGRPIAELIFHDPIDVIYLLYYGEMGTKEEIARFRHDLNQRSRCKEETLRSIEQLPRVGHSMDVFAAAILIAGMYEGTGDYREDCLNVIAKLPQIAAAVINSHAGWGSTPQPKPELGYMENFVHMLNIPGSKPSELTEVLRIFDVISFDHSGGNLSTFVGKAV